MDQEANTPPVLAPYEPLKVTAGPPPDLDTNRPHPARMYDYLLGGKDNFPADRAAADAARQVMPNIRTAALETRAFGRRATMWLAEECGIRQFLDIGTGIPTRPNTHEIAQTVNATARVVYVDNDPLVAAHARALLVSTPEGATAFLNADLREPDVIIEQAARTLDFDKPVALLVLALLHFVPDSYEPRRLLDELIGALPPGSYVAASHVVPDRADIDKAEAIYAKSGIAVRARTVDEFEELVFAGRGLRVCEPGILPVSDWRPLPGPRASLDETGCYGGVARLAP